MVLPTQEKGKQNKLEQLEGSMQSASESHSRQDESRLEGSMQSAREELKSDL